jgi:hypothetical protein
VVCIVEIYRSATEEAEMPAKRGDIAVIVTERRDCHIGKSSTIRTEVEVTEVTSVTREGAVKAVRFARRGAPSIPVARLMPHTTYVVPRAEFDVASALDAARAHHWPNHPDQPKHFDSLDEVRGMLIAHRITRIA